MSVLLHAIYALAHCIVILHNYGSMCYDLSRTSLYMHYVPLYLLSNLHL